MSRAWMVPACLLAIAVLCTGPASCGGASGSWTPRPPVPQPPTRLIGGIPVAAMCTNLPGLTEADVAELLARAEREMPGVLVRRIVHSRTHPIETPIVTLEFECHRTSARIRRGRTISITWNDWKEGGAELGHRSRKRTMGSSGYAEICAPGRSFLEEQTAPQADIVHVRVSADLGSDEIVDVVDAAYDHVPAGEKLASIQRLDDGVFKVRTVVARKGRSLSGSILRARRVPWGWWVSLHGEWVS